MRSVYIPEMEAEIAFAKEAAAHFAANPRSATFTADEIKEGVRLALRWGTGDDCVLVVKLDEYRTPLLYAEVVQDALPRIHRDAEADRLLLLRALVAGVARWEPFRFAAAQRVPTGEVCVGGMRYSTPLDADRVPILSSPIRAALLAQLTPEGT